MTAAAPLPSIILKDATRLVDGSIRFTFTNLPGTPFTVLAATNASSPLSNWTEIGGVTEITPGRFQFTDASVTAVPSRFYRIRSP